MAMIRVEPVEVHVRTGWLDGSPREITWGNERLSVTRLNAVREEEIGRASCRERVSLTV